MNTSILRAIIFLFLCSQVSPVFSDEARVISRSLELGIPPCVNTRNFSTNCYGTFVLENGDRYFGPVDSAGMFSGYAIYRLSDGRIYEGEFLADQAHGNGTFVWPDGDKYTGEWRNDQRHGVETLTRSGGSTEKRYWFNDKQLSSVPSYLEIPLKKGDMGASVYWTKRQLGMPTTTTSTEAFDDALQQRIYQLQRVNQLKVDGVVGLATLNVLAKLTPKGNPAASGNKGTLGKSIEITSGKNDLEGASPAGFEIIKDGIRFNENVSVNLALASFVFLVCVILEYLARRKSRRRASLARSDHVISTALPTNDEHVFMLITEEFNQGIIDSELWAKAMTLHYGDEKKAKYEYIRLKVSRTQTEKGTVSSETVQPASSSQTLEENVSIWRLNMESKVVAFIYATSITVTIGYTIGGLIVSSPENPYSFAILFDSLGVGAWAFLSIPALIHVTYRALGKI